MVWHVLPSLSFPIVSLEYVNKPNINVICFLLVSHSILYHVFFPCFSINFITWRGTCLNLEIGCLVYSQSSFCARPICLIHNVCFLLSYSIQFNLSTIYKLAQGTLTLTTKLTPKLWIDFVFNYSVAVIENHMLILLFSFFILYYIIAWIIQPQKFSLRSPEVLLEKKTLPQMILKSKPVVGHEKLFTSSRPKFARRQSFLPLIYLAHSLTNSLLFSSQLIKYFFSPPPTIHLNKTKI